MVKFGYGDLIRSFQAVAWFYLEEGWCGAIYLLYIYYVGVAFKIPASLFTGIVLLSVSQLNPLAQLVD
jgi:hypothetical protein